MSVEDAQKFLLAVREDAGLRRRADAISGGNVLEKLAVLGQEAGFHFSVEEYREAVVQEAEGELSDEALGEVLDELGLQKRNQA